MGGCQSPWSSSELEKKNYNEGRERGSSRSAGKWQISSPIQLTEILKTPHIVDTPPFFTSLFPASRSNHLRQARFQTYQLILQILPILTKKQFPSPSFISSQLHFHTPTNSTPKDSLQSAKNSKSYRYPEWHLLRNTGCWERTSF
jgi:hypothetical protein